jgi:iron complex transport system substrate-binding protein
MKPFWSFLLIGILSCILFAACSYRPPQIAPLMESELECRVVQGIVGETCIPLTPQRIVALHQVTLGNLLTLGIKPVGSVSDYSTEQLNQLPEYLGSKTEGIKFIGEVTQPSLEATLLLKPDLIIDAGYYLGNYPLIEKIAPTVTAEWIGPISWRNYFDFIVDLLGKQEEAQQAWKHYHQRVDELRAALGDRYQEKKISVILTYSGQIYSDVKDSFTDFIIKSVGLKRIDEQNIKAPPYGVITIPAEEIERIDGDIILVVVSSEKDQKLIEQLTQKPLWQKLRAVQQKHVYFVSDSVWKGSNLLAAEKAIDDLFRCLGLLQK